MASLAHTGAAAANGSDSDGSVDGKAPKFASR